MSVVAVYQSFMDSSPVHVQWDGKAFSGHKDGKNLTGRMDALEVSRFIADQLASSFLLLQVSEPGTEVLA